MTTRFQRGATLALAIFVFLTHAAGATGHTATITYDPTPGQPNSGDECTITIKAPVDNAQSHTDVAAVKAAMDKALMDSDDMRTKVGDACTKHNKMLEINVVRDNKGVFMGDTALNGKVNVDPGDIDAAKDKMEGTDADKTKVADNLLIELLAHEIDHNRHSATDDHKDPAKDRGTSGKPVDDENAVLKDLGAGVVRNNYGYRDKDGKLYLDWTVGVTEGKKVRLKITEHQGARTKASKFSIPTEWLLPTNLLQNVPAGPCGIVLPPCYPHLATATSDLDLDGVPDAPGPDNCPQMLANPQQADTDQDGSGQGCEADDDGDGALSEAEAGAGASDMDTASSPEHWSQNPTCTDGLDNDADRLVDALDEGCVARLPSFQLFPAPVAPGATFPIDRRRDLGGVPDHLDTVDSFFDITYDINMDGIPDLQLDLRGSTVIRRDPPISLPPPEHIDIEMVAMSLVSVNPITASLKLDLAPTSPGIVRDASPSSPSNFPADSFFDVFVELDLGHGPLRPVAPLRLEGIVRRWPPHGEILPKPPALAPMPFLNSLGQPAGQALGWSFGAYGQGDCNGDRLVDAGDLSAVALEIFDGDGADQPQVTQGGPGSFGGRPIGCDANGDGLVNAGDLPCVVLEIFQGPASCN